MNHLRTEYVVPQRSNKQKAAFRILDPGRNHNDKLKCSASEMLAAYQPLRHFAETKADGLVNVSKELASFLAVCRVQDIILLAKRRALAMTQAAELLKAAVPSFLCKHKEAYGTQFILPKHHCLFDIAEQFGMDEQVWDCFIVERLHLPVKRVAEDITNTRSYETSVLAAMQYGRLRRLERLSSGDALIQPTAMFPGIPGALISKAMVCAQREMVGGDVVFLGTRAGEIVACAQEDTELYLVMQELRLESNHTQHSRKYTATTDTAQIWPASRTSQCDNWVVRGGSCVALHLGI